ncbi:MAG: cell division protein FtsX [Rhodovarius sp.]|nr:cell division protein FtsX [Rhodovarius sp.]
MARRRRDLLGLDRALSDRLLPLLVAAMALLAALAMAAALGAAALAARWQGGAAAALIVELPPAADPAAARALIASLPGVAEATLLDRARLAALLSPWIGSAEGFALPALLELRLATAGPEAEALPALIAARLPGARVEAHGLLVARLLALAEGLGALSALVLLLVAAVAAAMVAVATRAGLAARRETIVILHGLGATDSVIAGGFAGRLAWLAALGAALGAGAAVPLLLLFGRLAAPLLGPAAAPPWIGLSVLPPLAALVAWVTAQLTVRLWLRQLP